MFILRALRNIGQNYMAAVAGDYFNYADQHLGAQLGVQNDLGKLKSMLHQAKLIISTVERMQITDEVPKRRLKLLLLNLRDTTYETHELLDLIQGGTCRSQPQRIGQQGYDGASHLRSSTSSTLRPRKKIRTSLTSSSIQSFDQNDIDNDDDTMSITREIQRRLDSITAEIDEIITILDADDAGKKQMIASKHSTTSLFVETRACGRDKELEKLVKFLLEPADEFRSTNDVFDEQRSSIEVLAMVGMGGVGKTTLAQLAYGHESVGDYFQLKIWVCVGENFNMERLLKEIIESITKEKCHIMNFDALQVALKKKITAKRFLLVLDDMWNADRDQWNRHLGVLLEFGAPGSKVLVTTRFRSLADVVGSSHQEHLHGLDRKDFLALLREVAFGSDQNSGGYPVLGNIAVEIAEMVNELLPLEARMLGGLLNVNLDVKYWRTIQESKSWKLLPQNGTNILPVLQLCYQYLPAHLKLCLAFCSLYPKGHRYHKDELIRIWMAHGLAAAGGAMRMEDRGSSYFNELVRRSFFQKSQCNLYLMHDLIHDLVQSISVGKTCRVGDGKSQEIPSTLRHLSALSMDMDPTKLTEFRDYCKLQTLMLPKLLKFRFNILCFPLDMFGKLKSLRVLVLQSSGMRELPAIVGDLIHLRYLDISYNPGIRWLPKSLCSLYNLQTLAVLGCNLKSFPREIINLSSLRRIDARDKIISEIYEVGKLTSLQELSAFRVLNDHGRKISELSSLVELHGKLGITHLQNIENIEEATRANLKNKVYLDRVEFEWVRTPGRSLENSVHFAEKVLESLQPHCNIKSVEITGYFGIRSPSWQQKEVLPNLKSLKLVNCKRLEDPLHIAQLHNLRILRMKRMPKVKRISPASDCPTKNKLFPMLEELVLENMPALMQLPNLQQVPHLKVLQLKNLPSLKHLIHRTYHAENDTSLMIRPARCYSFPDLQVLVVEDLPRLVELPDLGELPCLKVLYIKEMSELKRIGARFFGDKQDNWLPKLEKLELKGMKTCKELPSFGQLPGLKVLRLEKMLKVKKITLGSLGATVHGSWFPSLEQLEFVDMPEWEEWSWTEGTELFPRLHRLAIEECPKMLTLCPLPPSLRELELRQVSLREIPRLGKEIDGDDNNGTPLSLSKLCLSGCSSLRNLKEGLLSDYLPNISVIEIRDCEELLWLPIKRFKEFTCLERLTICGCQKLIMDTDILLAASIKELELSDCGDLGKYLPDCLQNLTSLTELLICDNSHIMSLSKEAVFRLEELEKLHIGNCSVLQSIEGLEVLKSLETLRIRGCPKLLEGQSEQGQHLSLKNLEIDDTELLKLQPLRETLPAVLDLKIIDSSQEEMFVGTEQELLRSLSSLRKLQFYYCKNLQSLPTELHAVFSLRKLVIYDCPKIISLPGKGLPDSLIDLEFYGCDRRLARQLENYLAKIKSSIGDD